MRRSIPITMLCLCCAATVAVSQISGNESWRFGITGSATLNMHSGSLTTRDGLAECGTFENTSSLGWMLGNSGWYRLSTDVALNARIQYWKADGLFESPNPVQPLVALSDGTTVPLSTDYQLNTNVGYINLDLMALWYPLTDWFVGVGPQIGFNTLASFEQTESIVQPAFVEFANGGTERTIYAASFTNEQTSTPIRVGISAVLGRDIRVSERFLITPEVGYTFGITSVITDSDWKISALRGGVTLSYAFGIPEPERTPPPAEAPPPVAEVAKRPDPVASLDIESVTSDGATLAGADVVLTEMRSNDLVPLLPFVFFDAKSAAIPDRYRERPQNFTEAALQDSVLGIYHHLLNIVGERMTRYADANIEIAGFREPQDGETDASVALQRAGAVKDYLVREWNIAPSRITTTSGVLPPIVSSRSVADGRTENRRAEIRTSDTRVLAPVSRIGTMATIEPKIVRLMPNVSNPEEVATSSASINAPDGTVFTTLQGTQWTPDAAAVRQLLGPRKSARAQAVYAITSNEGAQRYATAPITVRRDVRSVRYSNEVVNDSVIERFRLIFFDYDAPTVSAFNRSVVDLVRSRIRTTSSLRITGLTDRIGPPERNKVLSLSRAQAIDAAIKERIVPERVIVRGAGAEEIYNNDLPEGRWYNRTVLIEIATPADSE